MPNLTPVSSFDDVPELETSTLALGGPGGPMNLPQQALLNRTQWLKDNAVAGTSGPYVAAAGTANAITATYTPPVTALVDGVKVRFEAAATNTGAVTFAPNGLTAEPVIGGAFQPLQGGEIASGGVVDVVWNAALTSWVIVAQAGGAMQVADAAQSQQAASKAQVDQITADLASSATGKGANLVAYGTDTVQGGLIKSLKQSDVFADFVVSGLLSPTSGTLSSTLAAGVAYVTGQRTAVAAAPYTYTASQDTYVDLTADGVLHYLPVANGAAAPAVTANALRLQKVVTGATAVTSMVQLAAIVSAPIAPDDVARKTALAAPTGSSLVGYGAGTIADSLDSLLSITAGGPAKHFATVTALLAGTVAYGDGTLVVVPGVAQYTRKSAAELGAIGPDGAGNYWSVLPTASGRYSALAFFELDPTDNAANLAALASNLPAVAGVLVFPAVTYNIASTVLFDIPAGWIIEANGALFVMSHDGIGFNLNPNFNGATNNGSDAHTKRYVQWFGGSFTNSNASKTASVAIQAFGMRFFRVDGAIFGSPTTPATQNGFYTAISVAAKDTYFIEHNYFYSNTISVRVPAIIPTNAGDCTLEMNIRLNTFSSAGMQNIILVEDKIIGLNIEDNGIIGACSAGQVAVKDNPISFNESIRFAGNHYEQVDSNGSIVFTSANSKGHYNTSIEDDFSGSVAAFKSVILSKNLGISIKSKFRNGATQGLGAVAISVDVNSRNVVIWHEATIGLNSNDRFIGFNVSPDKAIYIASGARRYVSGIPAMLSTNTPAGLTGFNNTTFSTTSETTMNITGSSGLLTNAVNWPLPPSGYFLGLRVQDSGSSAATSCWFAIRNGTAAGSDALELRVDLPGVVNSQYRGANGFVPADDAGNISYTNVATGSLTQTATLVITGVTF